MAIDQMRELRDDLIEEDEEGSDSEYDSDDSENDPSFSILPDTSTGFSDRTSKNKSKNRVNLGSESEPDEEEVSVPELGEKDKRSFETVQKVIQAGQVEKLKVDQCKVYLRKNGLRLTGNKDTLILRIKEHLEILNGGGEMKYPSSSFVLNCKGDACMGDVVMFEQNVYEMFNLASRSASGPPCGTRTVVGRIVKESYGAAKQQHTFTIEVLWSKGEKPLPPLHPLLIKGRNLYRLRTLRQRWEDEGQRQKALMEKHSRGSLARSDREVRIEEKKLRKMLKETRISRKAGPKKKQPYQPRDQQTGSLTGSGVLQNQFIGLTNHSQQQSSSSVNPRKPVAQPQHAGFAADYAYATVPTQQHQQQNNQIRQMGTQQIYSSSSSSIHEVQHQRSSEFHHANYNVQQLNNLRLQDHVSHTVDKHANAPFEKAHHHIQQPLRSTNNMNPPQRQGQRSLQPCKHYAQGRCYFGENCKFLHDAWEGHPRPQRLPEEAWHYDRNRLGSHYPF